AAARGGQLAARRRAPAGDLGYLGEGVAEDVVQDERDALGRGQRLEHDEERHADRLVEGDPVGGVDDGGVRAPAAPLRGLGQRLGKPFARVALAPDPRRAEQVQADAAGHGRQPGGGRLDSLLLIPGHGVPAGVGLLHGVFRLGERAEQPVGEVDQLTPLAHDRVQARVGLAGSWLGSGAHDVGASLGHVLSLPTRRNTTPECEAALPPDVPALCAVVLVENNTPSGAQTPPRHHVYGGNVNSVLATETIPEHLTGTWKADPAHSEVAFSVRHLMVSNTRGRFTSYDVTIVATEAPLRSSVTATIDLASVDTGLEMRDEHLRSADYLDVEKYPTMSYRSAAV